ncbi:hypothetical protein G6F57_004839 [Rhizopus arrhizus]|uniref:DUF155 domain-containing protein n=1 Tax=Rhizopus oryzae TaxID=64495 RepID=A0A9P7BM05_RHIOR|nr:hypothetical protein G6F24_003564 [Rhizopus arrhizus]KAG0781551.1 hypothetical protein G6F21_011593 [Rhizopus arrhizus]KAG0786525.1 hypothetical protein G6F22_007599 [Rhizopus arrhizus]KAG0815898.1 hypothetical protein G6F20_003633 [Rhizopus arrhizus]KAG0822466.1 hypothetical protein G6F18_011760 [Rhizopus arrhizus]
MSQLKQQESNVPLLDATNTAQYSTFVEKGIRNTKPKQPMRTTKISQKLKLFPEDSEHQWADHDEPMDVYTQLAKIPHGMAREEAEMLNKMDRSQLSRMTAYCTASAYRMNELTKYLQSKKKTNGTAPKRFDECLYTPFALTYPVSPPHHHEDASKHTRLPEIFLFDYGVVVFWGMSFKDEQRVLKLLEPFEEEKLEPDDIETEEFHYYYNESYQPRIYNDIITLRNPTNYLVKLTIAHAIAQSVKMTLFERLIDDTINETKYIPQVMAESGNIQLSRTGITKKIGQLFIMRINVNLVSNILDTPEIFWSEPTLEPLYTAMRGYLEISQRVELLNQRVEVISDLLEMLKDHLNSSHGEQLEWIVIWLIGMEIVVAVITTCLDAFSLSHK